MLIRHQQNPILTRTDIPGVYPEVTDVSSVFNPGAVKAEGLVHLVLRVQNRGRETFLMHAFSKDGISFHVDEDPITIDGLNDLYSTIYHVYDPRLTRLDDRIRMVVAVDIETGCRLVIAEKIDWLHWKVIGGVLDEDTRNGVLFPDKIDGKYLLLDRPNISLQPGEPFSGERIRLRQSEDLETWKDVGFILQGHPHYWDELIGAGPPPVKTHAGWLLLYHGVATHFGSANIYQAGACLLDLDDPAKIIGRTRYNILEPRELYEQVGQVPNVVFPSGMVVDKVDEEGVATPESVVSVYYGAADTVVGLATATVSDLITACKE